MSRPSEKSRDATTLRRPVDAEDLATTKIPALTVLAHPDWRRVGERSVLTPLLSQSSQPLHRLEPDFSLPTGGKARPLDDPYVSRSPVLIHPHHRGGVLVDPNATSTQIEIDGVRLAEPTHLINRKLDLGVVLLLSDRIALLLHRIDAPETPPAFGLVGESQAMVRLRNDIRRLAPRPHTVLLRGETGTGKELVARALHNNGPRKSGPYQAINFGAIPPSLAASELFGTARGAFTGAGGGRAGYFQRADQGTLFLDEIAAAPHEVQSALLRVLESGEIQAVGAGRVKTVDTRIIAATDANLEDAAHEGTFQPALLYRLEAYEIRIPPLRERRDDIGRLIFHFLHQELEREQRLDKLSWDPVKDKAWVPAELIARLALYPWPGNVRQLKNLISRLVLDNLDSHRATQVTLSPSLLKLLETPQNPEPVNTTSVPRESPPPTQAPSRYQDVYEIDEDRLRDALKEHGFEVARAARALGVARPTLHKRMKLLGLPVAADLEPADIQKALTACHGDTRCAADRLRVSEHGLKMRMRKLNISIG